MRGRYLEGPREGMMCAVMIIIPTGGVCRMGRVIQFRRFNAIFVISYTYIHTIVREKVVDVSLVCGVGGAMRCRVCVTLI